MKSRYVGAAFNGGGVSGNAYDIANAQDDEIVITPESRQVRSAYPLWGSIQNFP